MSALETERLFFAIWPDEKLQSELHELLEAIKPDVKGRQLPLLNLHITLNFIGSVNVDQRQQIIECAKKIEVPDFKLELTRLFFRKRQRMLWLEANACPQPLTDLVDKLRIGMGGLGLEQENRRFLPHLTLMRKVNRCDVEVLKRSLCYLWKVNEFVLVRSQTFPTGAEYEIVQRFPLHA